LQGGANESTCGADEEDRTATKVVSKERSGQAAKRGTNDDYSNERKST
jgi:hypothetical protein